LKLSGAVPGVKVEPYCRYEGGVLVARASRSSRGIETGPMFNAGRIAE